MTLETTPPAIDPEVRILRALHHAEALAAMRSVPPHQVIMTAAAAEGVEVGELAMRVACKLLACARARAALAAMPAEDS